MSKEQTWKNPIVGGVAGATVGAILGAAYGESIGALELAVIGGALGTFAGYLQETTKRWQKLKFPIGKEVDVYLNATPLIEKYIQDKVDRGLKVEGNLHFLPNKEFEEYAFKFFLRRLTQGGKMPQGKEPFKAPESDLIGSHRPS